MAIESTRISVPFAAEDTRPFIFASYAHADKELVFPLIKRLYEGGWRVWYDQGIEIAAFYDEVIAKHIADCDALLLFVSNNSVNSYYTIQNELKYALRLGKRVVLYWLEAVALPSSLDMLIGGGRCEEAREPDIFKPFLSVGRGEKRMAKGLTLNAADDKPTENDEYDYESAKEGIILTKYKGDLEHVRVPQQVNGQTVVGLRKTFDDTNIVSVSLPDTIRSVGELAFGGCVYLAGIELPEGVEYIGDSAFYGCYGIETIVLPSTVRYIGDNVFYSCDSLRSITFLCDRFEQGEDEDIFGDDIGYYDYDREDDDHLIVYCRPGSTGERLAMEIGLTVKPLDESVYTKPATEPLPFRSCAERPFLYASFASTDADTVLPILTALNNDGYNIRWSERRSFGGRIARDIADCEIFLAYITKTYAQSTELDNELRLARHLGKWVVLVWLERCELPSDLNMLEGGRQGMCVWDAPLADIDVSLRNMLIEEGCKGRVNLSIPDFLYRLEDGKLILTKYIGEGGAVEIKSEYFPGIPTAGIDKNAFVDAEGVDERVVSVVIPATVSALGWHAFDYCLKLETVTLPVGLKSIGWSCFANCRSLRNIIIPDSVEKLGSGAFKGCSSLERIVLPSSLGYIGSDAFEGCNRLTAVVSAQSYAMMYCDENAVSYEISNGYS